jgi:hypothetical protein
MRTRAMRGRPLSELDSIINRKETRNWKQKNRTHCTIYKQVGKEIPGADGTPD